MVAISFTKEQAQAVSEAIGFYVQALEKTGKKTGIKSTSLIFRLLEADTKIRKQI